MKLKTIFNVMLGGQVVNNDILMPSIIERCLIPFPDSITLSFAKLNVITIMLIRRRLCVDSESITINPIFLNFKPVYQVMQKQEQMR